MRPSQAGGANGSRSGYALITGASRGLGAVFASALAAQRQNLVLSARSEPDLQALRERLLASPVAAPVVSGARASRPIDIVVIPADLRSGGAKKLLAAVAERGLEIDLLINNAGLGSLGRFEDLEITREREEVAVNVDAVVELTHGLLPPMRRRGRGAIMQVASTAGFQPVPYMATYAATKAFVLNFSQALREETRDTGVQVMALCPGPTRTSFFEAAGIVPQRGPMQSPEEVVQLALAGLRQGKAVVVCGAQNRIMVAAERLLPRQTLTRLVGNVIRSWQKKA